MTPYYDHAGITIYHGDCREILPTVQADVVVTDPPYGMAFVSSWTTRRRPIAGDRDAELRDDVLRTLGDIPMAVFGTWKVERPAGTKSVLIWDKSDGVGCGMGDLGAAFGTSHEGIYLIGEWPLRGKRRPSVLRTACCMSSMATTIGHPTPKPESLMRSLLDAAPEGVVLDPFMGSGSTLVAAKQLGSRAIGIEIEERYCEIAAKRLSQETLPFGVSS